MNFLSMDYFLMTAQKRSFTKAADSLHITQQTLSTHIANLEQELGTRLFIRNVPLKLTYAGEVFLSYAMDFQKNYQSLQHEFSDMNRNEQGILRIGISFTRCRAIMPKILDHYQELFPKMQIHIHENGNDTFQKNLTEQHIDLAVGKFPQSLPGIHIEDFYEEEIVLILREELFVEHFKKSKLPISLVSSLKELSPEQFRLFETCPFLLNYEMDIAGQIGHSYLRKANFKPIIRVKSDNMGMLLELCLSGKGACFAPLNLVLASLPEDVKLLDADPIDEYSQNDPVSTSSLQRKMRIIHLGQSAKYNIRFATLEQPYQWKAIRNFMDAAKACVLTPPDNTRSEAKS